MDNVLLVVSAADDDVIHPGKSGLAVSNSSIHVPLEGWTRVPQTKRHPLLLEQAEGGGDGGLLYICRIHRDLVLPLPQVDLGEDGAAHCLGGEVQYVGEPVHIWLGCWFGRLKSPHGRQLPSAFFTMCKGLDQGDVEH